MGCTQCWRPRATLAQRRYLPAVYLVELPRPEAMSFPGSFPSIGHPQLSLPLYSAPNRPAPPGFAAIRAQIREYATGHPVPYAVLRVRLGTLEGDGVADRSGQVLALIAQPISDRLIAGSPPGTGQAVLGDVTWPITAQVLASAGISPPAVVSGPGSFPELHLDAALPHPWSTLPTSRAILTQPQVPVVLSTSSSVLDLSATLVAGEDLVLSTMSSSYLVIASAASPP
jgi:hypothetical protein